MPLTRRFGLSTHLFHGERLARAHLESVKTHGFDLVEIFATRTHVDYHDERQVAQIRRWLDELALSAWSVHAPICDGIQGGLWGRPYSIASTNGDHREEAVAETGKAVGAARALGASALVLHLGIPEGQPVTPADNDAAAVRRSLAVIAAACDAAGLHLALEVIPNALATAAAVYAWLEADVDMGRAGACLDVGHAHLTGGAPEAAELLAGYLITTHLHDNDGQRDEHLVPFDGTIDWAATLLALSKGGYDGPLIFELPGHGDSLQTLARAARARTQIQAILDDLSAPFPFRDDP
jgi:sugar phosphate isomerase/epimerase